MVTRIRFFFTFIFLFIFSDNTCLAQNTFNPLLSPNIASMSAQAVAAESRGDLMGAINMNKKILEIQPASVCSMNSIAGLYGKLGQYDNEILWAQKAINIDKSYSPAYINYGSALASKGKLAEARQAYETAAQLNPKSAIPIYNLGILADKQNDYMTAIQFYQNAIALNPKSEDAYYNLGIDYVNLKKYPEAIAAFKQVLSLNPKAADAKKMLTELENKQ